MNIIKHLYIYIYIYNNVLEKHPEIFVSFGPINRPSSNFAANQIELYLTQTFLLTTTSFS